MDGHRCYDEIQLVVKCTQQAYMERQLCSMVAYVLVLVSIAKSVLRLWYTTKSIKDLRPLADSGLFHPLKEVSGEMIRLRLETYQKAQLLIVLTRKLRHSGMQK